MKIYRNITVAALFVTLVFAWTPVVQAEVSTNGMTEVQKQVLIAQLVEQLTFLQAKLAELTKGIEITDSNKNNNQPTVTLGYDGMYRNKYEIDRRLELDLNSKLSSINEEDVLYWDLFVDVAGEDFVEEYIREFWVFDSEKSSAAAFVQPEWVKSPRWILGLNVNGFDLNNPDDVQELLYTYVHEMAHIIALNRLQADHNEDKDECDTHYILYACLDKDAYQYEFIKEFWSESDLEYAKDSEEIENYTEKVDFVTVHHDRSPNDFVSVYAASDPAEDFAESFTEFVLHSNNSNVSPGVKKVQFFNRYKEMLEIRSRIYSAYQNALIR